MRLYSQIVFPRLLDWSMSSESMQVYRQELLAGVTGNVLEIGFGTGLNMPYYPHTVSHLTVVDPNPGMKPIARRRTEDSTIPVEFQLLSGESLPMPDGVYDSVVSTWTLCSIPDIEQALAEIHRVLKPGGRFFFIEHGLSDEAKIQTWQHRLTPIQKVVADGCHLNRSMAKLIGQFFDQLEVDQFYARGLPKVVGYFYKGIAVKSS
ncbi:class I SAM-dependent methyltransferase [Romeria aff. gracilis LEGE 07310]|uniref:Class I SAM-dependent methyltransferase n=1 Tax=Vasconcelosia minhoensis LEGE 07310 TaxID=915328 RepID=A0A8J7DQI7_9CYAN|nr:class I SAM-dependent methyltransferase [Romeria gracilis]MBE9076624.1 class I SAM-dependent methyltransferase [Romeria aff. gracilis LEGE 07310]